MPPTASATYQEPSEVGPDNLEKQPLANNRDSFGFGDVVKGFTEIPPGFVKMFPTTFLLFTLSLFIIPIYLVIYFGSGVNEKKWLPGGSLVVVILPVLYATTFIIHTITRKPSRIFIMLNLLGSCVMLLVLGNIYLNAANQQAPMLDSTDCLSWPAKRDVQHEWDLARTFYASCVSEKAKQKKIKFAAAADIYRMRDCPDYDKQVSRHPDWSYLEHMEDTQRCSGWCKFEPPLWTRERTQDPCSPAAGLAIKDKANHAAKQVSIYAVIALCAVGVVFVSITPLLNKFGLDW